MKYTNLFKCIKNITSISSLSSVLFNKKTYYNESRIIKEIDIIKLPMTFLL